MKGIVILTGFTLVFSFDLLAQDRASMTAPIIKPSVETIAFTARFSDFVAGDEHRLGVGTAKGKINKCTIELFKNETPLQKREVSFKQGHASHWWDINLISMRGFVFKPVDLPKKGETLTMTVTVPRAELNQVKKLYILVARRYAENLWYIEDGAEVDDSNW